MLLCGGMAARHLLIIGVSITLTLRPSTADAQLETFVQAVRELGDATAQPEPARSNGIRAAATRMDAALVEWDSRITALEARVGRESRGAPDRRASQLHIELGVAYRARGRIADALREFEAASALERSAPDLHVLRALTLEAAGRSDEAGQAFRVAWNLDAGDPVKAYYAAARPGAGNTADRDRARAVLTDTYRRLRVDAARPSTAPFVTLDAIPDNLSRTPIVADETTGEGFALLLAGRYGDAVAALGRLERANGEKSEDSPLGHFARGQRHEAQNHVADARREYQAALDGALVGRSVLLVGLARLAQVEGDVAGATGAIDAFTRALRLNPNDPNIRKELAGAYAAEGRVDQAFCELMAALFVDPRDAQVHAAIGQLYLDAGRDAEAVTAFNRALELTPGRYETRYALATAYARLGNTAEAARQLEIFDRLRREALEQRRRGIANEVEQEESLRNGAAREGGAR